MSPIQGADVIENAKPLAHLLALNETRRFRLHVAVSQIHLALQAGDAAKAEEIALAALRAERDAASPDTETGQG